LVVRRGTLGIDVFFTLAGRVPEVRIASDIATRGVCSAGKFDGGTGDVEAYVEVGVACELAPKR